MKDNKKMSPNDWIFISSI